MMLLIDIAVAIGAFLAAAYCLLLSRRVRALTRLDGDMGAAIATLSQQVDALTRALEAAAQSSGTAQAELEKTIARAEATMRSLELMVSAAKRGTSATDQESDAGWSRYAPASHPSRDDDRPRVLRSRQSNGLHR